MVGVFIAPALAIYPRLLQKPLTSCAIPVLSAMLVFCLTSICISFNVYCQQTAITLILIFVLMAIIRTYHFCYHFQMHWTVVDGYFALANGLIMLPLCVLTYFSAFTTNDEVYSWGLWAFQHYHSLQPSYQFTGAVYPQLFPVVMSFCFKLLGSMSYQASVKLALLLFPFTALTLIASMSSVSTKSFPYYLCIVLLSVFPGDYYAFYSKAYADPMMMTSLLASVAFLIRFRSTQLYEYLWLSVCCGVTASLTKQPALWWVLCVFPGISLIGFHQSRDIRHVLAGILMAYPAGVWLISTHYGFIHNSGVTHASFANRTYLSQLYYAIDTYFVHQPTVLLLYLLTFFAIRQHRFLQILFFFLIVPYTFMWFMWGAYALRLGVHCTYLCGLFISASLYQDNFTLLLSRRQLLILTMGLNLWLIKTGFSAYHLPLSASYPLQGERTVLSSLYQDEFVFEHILDRQVKVWVGDAFNYGVLYGHAALFYPGNQYLSGLSVEELQHELTQFRPDYLIDPGKAPNVYGRAVTELIHLCPQLFSEKAKGNQFYRFVVYRLNLSALDVCESAISGAKANQVDIKKQAQSYD
jgi:hypothetical protein